MNEHDFGLWVGSTKAEMTRKKVTHVRQQQAGLNKLEVGVDS